MRRRWFGVLGTLALMTAITLFAVGSTTAASETTEVYLVQLAQDPVAVYDGGIEGYAATKPGKGSKIDPQSADVQKYVGYLKGRHDKALEKVGGAQKVYDYAYAANGFTAVLTEAQAEALSSMKGVVSVEKNEAQSVDTVTTPGFLGLDATDGLWSQLGGQANAGDEVVVGVIDTGIWPEHPSVSDRTGVSTTGKGTDYKPVADFHGHCMSAEQTLDGSFDANLCNQKLVAAQAFFAINQLVRGTETIVTKGFGSPRDGNGHGTHTATTAAGNGPVTVTGDAAAAVGSKPMSGMAPRARIAAYKVCFDDGNDTTGDCFTGDSAAAIDQAVHDGVDVINFSIGGDTVSTTSLVATAFRNAAAAGVFVAASAGNSGPGASTVAHVNPWTTTVAASSHPRAATGLVVLGNGTTIQGIAQITAPTGVKPLIRSDLTAPTGATAEQVTNADLCVLGSLDAAKVVGKIVACKRGVNARIDKSMEVRNKGGVGMVLYNSPTGSLNGDLHFVPTVHIDDPFAAPATMGPVATYAATPGATANLTPGGTPPAYPQIGAFSSRGPILGIADLLKPDISAPGVDILAGYSPATPNGANRLFDIISGTSMSSPHIAGLAALLKHKHPTWSPMAIKSALMTSATDLAGTFSGTVAANAAANRAFAQGAGHANPNGAADPGLVYDSTHGDWIKYICAIGQATGTACTPRVDPSDLNLASIAIGDLAGVQTVKRTVTNVDDTAATYNVSVDAPAGITVTVNPTSLTLAPGEAKSYEVTLTYNGASPLNTAVGGSLTWSDGTHNVRSPIVVRPVPLAAPTEVTGTAAGITYNITTGYDGPLQYVVRGLVAADEFPATVPSDPGCTFVTANPASNAGVTSHNVVVPAGTTIARFSLFNDAQTNGPDLDLYVYRVGTNAAGEETLALVGSSTGSSTNEQVQLANPTAATYRAFVHGCTVTAASASYTFYAWKLGTADALNTTVTGPSTATIGGSHQIGLGFTGLTAGKRYFGQVRYQNGAALLGTTLVRVNA